MGFARGKSDFQHIARTVACVEDRAPASLAMRIDQIVDRRVEPDARECVDDERALPLPISLDGPVLERAAAAEAEMRTDRRDALAARRLHFDQMAAVGM